MLDNSRILQVTMCQFSPAQNLCNLITTTRPLTPAMTDTFHFYCTGWAFDAALLAGFYDNCHNIHSDDISGHKV